MAGKFALSVEVVAIIHVDRSEAVWSNSKAGLKGHEPSEWIQPVIESRFTARVRREKNLPIRFGGSILHVMSALVANFINRDRCKDGAYRWLECGQSRQQYNRSVLAPLKNAIDVGLCKCRRRIFCDIAKKFDEKGALSDKSTQEFLQKFMNSLRRLGRACLQHIPLNPTAMIKN